jgi:cysteine desulfurase
MPVARLLKRGGHPVQGFADETRWPDRSWPQPKAADRKDTALVTIIHAQNEIAHCTRRRSRTAKHARAVGALVHADAAQSIGKVAVRRRCLGGRICCRSPATQGLRAKGKWCSLCNVTSHKNCSLCSSRRSGTWPAVPGTENVPISSVSERPAGSRHGPLEKSPQMARVAYLCCGSLSKAVPGNRSGLDIRPNPGEYAQCSVSWAFPAAGFCKTVPMGSPRKGFACHADNEEPSRILLARAISADQARSANRAAVGRRTNKPLKMQPLAAASAAEGWRVPASRSEPVGVLRRVRR